MGKGETVHLINSAPGKKENKRKSVVKSPDLNLTEDSPVLSQKRQGTTPKVITESLDKKMWKKSKDADKDEEEQENEGVELLAKEIEKKCRILREQLGRDFPGKGGQGQSQLQVKIDQLEETVNEKSEEISQLKSKIKHMAEKQEMILNLLMGNEDEDRTTTTTKSKLKLAHLGHMTNLLSVSKGSPQEVTISTGIFKERDEFSDKDLRCTKIKTSRPIVLRGLGFSAPLDQDDEFKVSAVVRANNDKVEVGKWTKLIQGKKGEKILLQFDKPIKLKAGKSYEIEYALKGPRLENELSEKIPLTKTQRTNRRRTPANPECRFNFAAYDKEKYTVSSPAVTFQIRQFKEEKGALCLLSYSVDLTSPRKTNEKKSRGKDEDEDDEEDEEDGNDSANEEKNVYVTSERYSESSSEESSSSDEEEKNPADQTDD